MTHPVHRSASFTSPRPNGYPASSLLIDPPESYPAAASIESRIMITNPVNPTASSIELNRTITNPVDEPNASNNILNRTVPVLKAGPCKDHRPEDDKRRRDIIGHLRVPKFGSTSKLSALGGSRFGSVSDLPTITGPRPLPKALQPKEPRRASMYQPVIGSSLAFLGPGLGAALVPRLNPVLRRSSISTCYTQRPILAQRSLGINNEEEDSENSSSENAEQLPFGVKEWDDVKYNSPRRASASPVLTSASLRPRSLVVEESIYPMLSSAFGKDDAERERREESLMRARMERRQPLSPTIPSSPKTTFVISSNMPSPKIVEASGKPLVENRPAAQGNVNDDVRLSSPDEDASDVTFSSPTSISKTSLDMSSEIFPSASTTFRNGNVDLSDKGMANESNQNAKRDVAVNHPKLLTESDTIGRLQRLQSENEWYEPIAETPRKTITAQKLHDCINSAEDPELTPYANFFNQFSDDLGSGVHKIIDVSRDLGVIPLTTLPTPSPISPSQAGRVTSMAAEKSPETPNLKSAEMRAHQNLTLNKIKSCENRNSVKEEVSRMADNTVDSAAIESNDSNFAAANDVSTNSSREHDVTPAHPVCNSDSKSLGLYNTDTTPKKRTAYVQPQLREKSETESASDSFRSYNASLTHSHRPNTTRENPAENSSIEPAALRKNESFAELSPDQIENMVVPISDRTVGNGASGVIGTFKSSVETVEIEKGRLGLGFCIEGGQGSASGDRPITIKRLFKGNTAVQEKLRAGDEILSINGKELTVTSQYDAWNYIKGLPDGQVTLVIRRN